jgi:hypothetical protein
MGLDEGSDIFTEGLQEDSPFDSIEGRKVECRVGTFDGRDVGTVEGLFADR